VGVPLWGLPLWGLPRRVPPPRVHPKSLKGALQLLSKRHKKIRFAHVHEQVLLLRSVELLKAITGDVSMKLGTSD